jgi:hypothetical protein
MRIVEYLSLALIGIGILGLIIWGAWSFFTDGEVALGLRILAGLAATGFVLLLGYVIVDRIHKARKEPKEIKEVKH